MIPDVKDRLLRVIEDPHFSNRERQLAKSSLERINELEKQAGMHWTQAARAALSAERKNDLIAREAADSVDEFLKRNLAEDQ